MTKSKISAVLMSSIAITAAAQTSTIDTFSSWDGTTGIQSWGSFLGSGATTTYGQTITPTASQTNLTSFSFNMAAFTTGSPPQYTAGVYKWDATAQTVTGPALFTSSVYTAPDVTSFTKVTFRTGGVKLSPNQQYVLF